MSFSAEEDQTVGKSIFESALSVDAKIEAARTELLDFSARNRLLNVPRFSKSAKTVDVIDEKSSEVFRILVSEGKAMTFLAGAKGRDAKEGDNQEDLIELALPDDDDRDDAGRLLRHGDTRLQTKMTPNALQKRLLDLYFDARTLEEEQGVNILYLGLGTLKWSDPKDAENIRYAPLLLVPVQLERGSAAERFKLRARQEDYASNLSLEGFLDRVHQISMPLFEPSDQFSIDDYAEQVKAAVSIKPDWSVQPDDIVLGFFSFAKFLMYRDLDPSLWPPNAKFTDRSLIASLVSNGFSGGDELLSEDDGIDAHIAPEEMTHIVDADSSQTVAIHEVRKGRNLVIQGPPGTGKSQTIANIIAAAVADGRTVLFVAEKMAALEVVKRRLDQAGVGDACLELHSNKANKRALLAELQHTWDLGAPKGESPETVDRGLTETRDALNAHARRLHANHVPHGLSPYQVIGHLARLRRFGMPPSDIDLPHAVQWTSGERARVVALLSELRQRIDDIGEPARHPWYGVGLTGITPLDLDRLKTRLGVLRSSANDLVGDMHVIADAIQVQVADTAADFAAHAALAARLATRPEGADATALGDAIWSGNEDDVTRAVRDGKLFSDVSGKVNSQLSAAAWTIDPTALMTSFRRLPPHFPQIAFTGIHQLLTVLPRFLAAANALRTALGINASPTLGSIGRLVTIGERVADAPEASPDAFVAAIWERGLEQANDLAEAVAAYRDIRFQLEGKLADQAWDMDLVATRTAIAVHGEKLFKFASGDWRKAKAIVRTIMPETTPAETVRLLDLLHKGKLARATIKDGDSLGRAAFSADWRGEKSDPKPLESLVIWMRSLRGVGAEARTIASRLTDKTAVAARCEQTRGLLEETRKLLLSIWADLDDRATALFSNANDPDDVTLTQAAAVFKELAQADASFAPLTREPLLDAGARVTALQLLATGQASIASVEVSDPVGRAAFGSAWHGAASDWQKLEEIEEWVRANPDLRVLASGIERPGELAACAAGTMRSAERFLGDIGELFTFLKADPEIVTGVSDLSRASLAGLSGRLSLWIENEEQLSKYAAYNGRAADAANAGVGDIVERLRDGRVETSNVIAYFEMAFYEAVLRAQHAAEPDLARFDGEFHGRLVGEFADLDRSRMRLSQLEVVRAHHRRIPAVSGIGPVGVLRGEMARRRNHMPIRSLMHRASAAIQAIKPVFMMSPLSIAQFLPPGVIEFDLLVMDEASQIQPVDALGAVARAKQVVVVGDERQLPPTRFFSKMTSSGSEDDEEQDGAKVSDIESILGLFSARGLPERMLRWHYRSRHQSLIAVSNSQFYDSKLFIVPSPYTKEAGMGLRFHHVPSGVFEDSVNKVEAKVVAEAIIRHAIETPALSLGVAAFSMKQRREVQDQLELLRRLNPHTEEFFHSHPNEPFFVKNLENVQGDERDVILISVAYAKNAQGYMGMRFGPLGAEGGERRLNVLISRAKRRCEVYASITDEDIDLERGKGKGIFAFKLFLHFARTGRLAMAARADRSMDSVFEEQVMAALQERGYQVHPQVGIAGFFIDLAIADDKVPGRYLLGIECDGASYHDARSARDRDRLRQAVLEDHGWNIYRIWSSDWFQRPRAELERVVSAIEKAKADAIAGGEAGNRAKRAVPVEVITIERATATEIGLQQVGDEDNLSGFYEEAILSPDTSVELHEAPLRILVELVKQTVEIEGPIHLDEIVTRIRTAWGLQRAGSRIDSHVGNAIRMAVSSGEILRSGDFLLWPGANAILRDRSLASSPSLRRLELLPPVEIDLGLQNLIVESLGATEEEAINAVARGLGFKATSSQLRELIRGRIAALRANGDLVDREGMLMVADRTAAQ
ncbi:DUF3320 domain-containing protein [Pararhizobium qamdonense]|uniref:DUF3320 domain-containing protein n=1 Tax=Pararhizobium qamdonense TaxID=3031126 RepID=UPI0023E260DC|nr:DUF3320 domain-containing protein [Pararhizobium qamdonense]